MVDPEREDEQADADEKRETPADGQRKRPNSEHPIGSHALVITAAQASVAANRLPSLLTRVQTELSQQRQQYHREFECIEQTDDRAVFFVASDHWETVGERLGFTQREIDAVRRAHVQQLLRIGSASGRREEFEAAIEIRDAVVIGCE